ncbi:MAG: lipocalin family protein [Ignavibacteria bacterium]
MYKTLCVIFALFIISGCNKNIPDTEKNTTAQKKSDSTGKVERPVNQENLFGKWINEKDNMGFEIKIGGKAASINMATLDYNYWKLEGHKLILNATSKGVSNPGTTNEIFLIRELSSTRLMVSPSDNPSVWWTYSKK